MKIRLIIAVFLLVVVTVFALQNAVIVEVNILFWKYSLSRSLLIFIALAIGVIVGWFAGRIFRMSRRQYFR